MPLTFAICQVEVAERLYESLVFSVQRRVTLPVEVFKLYMWAIFVKRIERLSFQAFTSRAGIQCGFLSFSEQEQKLLNFNTC